MDCSFKNRRAVVVAAPDQAGPLVQLFGHPCLANWAVKVADSPEHARQHRAQASRLTDLLWQSLPVDGKPEWLSQRFMLERLYQEVLRCDRHGTPLTLVLGEWRVDPAHAAEEPEAQPSPGL